MRRKGIILILLGIMCIVASALLAATVTKQSEYRTKINISLNEGDRIIIIKAGYDRTYVKVVPSEFRIEDYKVPEGKSGSGSIFIK